MPGKGLCGGCLNESPLYVTNGDLFPVFSQGVCRAGSPSGSRRPLQQPLRRQILVDMWKVNAVANSRDPPIGPLPRRRME
jgi:hypothetical protein